MTFKGIQRTMKYTQVNSGHVDKVFPLLCPVREKDWLEGWNYKMIRSDSGLIEKNCVFTTPNENGTDTVWHVTQYNANNYKIEFVRVTPQENVVRINIDLESRDERTTLTHMRYQYTALNEEQNQFILNELESSFNASMTWWEKAINYYLETGKMLKKASK